MTRLKFITKSLKQHHSIITNNITKLLTRLIGLNRIFEYPMKSGRGTKQIACKKLIDFCTPKSQHYAHYQNWSDTHLNGISIIQWFRFQSGANFNIHGVCEFIWQNHIKQAMQASGWHPACCWKHERLPNFPKPLRPQKTENNPKHVSTEF